jgi:hypothetical protein
MTAEERLDRVERGLARARWFNRGLLVALVLCLVAGFVVCERVGQRGRYALSGEVILDTRTSQRWLVECGPKRSWITNLGTIERPTYEEPKCITVAPPPWRSSLVC